MDSPHLTPELLASATESIVQTRGGRQRAAVPRPIGECFFVNDLTPGELSDALAAHREISRDLPREGGRADMVTAA